MKRSYFVVAIILLVLVLDQALKFYIKLNFSYNEDVSLLGLDWAHLHFVENEGMAFGFTFGWKYGKLLLSLFRLLMVGGLYLYIRLLLEAKAPLGFLTAVGLITAGAIGNIIDSAVYGLIFTESPYHGGVAEMVSFGQGYGSFLHGKVVDMLYFPMTWIHMPDWSPIWGGEDILFFSPIFNIADASITCGVLIILLFQRSFFRDNHLEKDAQPTEEIVGAAEMPPADASENTLAFDDTSSDAPTSEEDAAANQDDPDVLA
ncbi:MAG: lipoprotein signal peptidase [Lewinellaceae bacterium]|nr:lipoprotein signal peptidase [Lewinellaceae bacterium]